MILKNIKTHETVTGNGIYHAYYSVFIECSHSDGGAIYSNADKTFIIETCFFVKCKADTRGAAALITAGECIFHKSCSEQCLSNLGADIQIANSARSIKYTGMQCFMFHAPVHATYLGATSVEITDTNISSNILSKNDDDLIYFGNCACFSLLSTFTAKYMNAFNNSGQMSLFLFEYFEGGSLSMDYINANYNLDHEFLISLCDVRNANLYISHSSFLNNKGTGYFHYVKESSNNKIYFSSCNFSESSYDSPVISFDEM